MKQHSLHWLIAVCLLVGLTACPPKDDIPPLRVYPDYMRLLAQDNDSKNNTYSIAYDNSVTKTDANGQNVWEVAYSNAPDTRTAMIAVDQNDTPWVIFYSSHTTNDLAQLMAENNAFTGVYMPNYSDNGNPDKVMVSIIAKLDPATGKITKATFLAGRLDNGNPALLRIRGLGFHGSNIAVAASADANAPGLGSSYQRFANPENGDLSYLYYEFNPDLSAIVRVETAR